MDSELFLPGDTDTLLVSFASCKGSKYCNFEFLNFFNKHYTHHNRLYYLDKHQYWYHRGMVGISTNIPETVRYLKNKIKGYKKVIFIGMSAGGYAAILFGSLLNVQAVLTFLPQTMLCTHKKREGVSIKNLDRAYLDIKPYINDVTQYIVYCDPNISGNKNIFHHFTQCNNIADFDNVSIVQIEDMNIKHIRDSGLLKKIIDKLIINSL
jgi:hypothetical protein